MKISADTQPPKTKLCEFILFFKSRLITIKLPIPGKLKQICLRKAIMLCATLIIFLMFNSGGMFWCVNIVRMCGNSCGLQDSPPPPSLRGSKGKGGGGATEIEFFRFDI